jgi:hypothetical protein
MAHSLTWLPDVLKAAGLRVSEVPGWENRGKRDVGKILIICTTPPVRNGNCRLDRPRRVIFGSR